mgnify:FL=1|tara:strand:+ start:1056 stop:1478 length:423 start_codon:yes stop_codon:yes gene_type:complete
MIKYKLNCKKCDKKFNSWFASSNEFENLKKKKYISCPFCNSIKVEKSLMSPNVINKKKDNIKIDNKYKKIKKKIQEYQKFIRSNLEYVGDNFAYKARTVHYDKKNYKKGIYGNATTKEIKELKDEGIETETIPWINDSEN